MPFSNHRPRLLRLLPTCGALFIAATFGACSGAQLAEVPNEAHATICVVRHAEAFKNLDPRPEMSAEQLDSLTPAGEAQALALVDVLPRIDASTWVASSPTGRTQATAALLAPDAEIIVDVRLRSLDGTMSWDDRVAAWSAGQDPRPADGESLADGQARVLALLDDVRAETSGDGVAVIVTHGDIAALVLGELRGTALLRRPTTDTLSTGTAVCVPLP